MAAKRKDWKIVAAHCFAPSGIPNEQSRELVTSRARSWIGELKAQHTRAGNVQTGDEFRISPRTVKAAGMSFPVAVAVWRRES